MMKINFFKKSIILSCLVFVAVSVCQLQSADLPPKPVLYGQAELFTALLRGPLAGYSQNVKSEFGQENNKSLLIMASLNLVRILNDGLALWNAYQKGDLLDDKKGKSVQQYLTLMFVLQDFLSLCDNTKNMWNNWKNSHPSDKVFEPIKSELELLSEKKLTHLTQRLTTYVLPFIETIAATVRAVDSMSVEYENERLELINYLCFVAISGCRNLSEYLQTKRGSLKQNWAIAKAVISATLILVDLKLNDNRRVAATAAAEAARVAADAATATAQRLADEREAAREEAVQRAELFTGEINGYEKRLRVLEAVRDTQTAEFDQRMRDLEAERVAAVGATELAEAEKNAAERKCDDAKRNLEAAQERFAKDRSQLEAARREAESAVAGAELIAQGNVVAKNLADQAVRDMTASLTDARRSLEAANAAKDVAEQKMRVAEAEMVKSNEARDLAEHTFKEMRKQLEVTTRDQVYKVEQKCTELDAARANAEKVAKQYSAEKDESEQRVRELNEAMAAAQELVKQKEQALEVANSHAQGAVVGVEKLTEQYSAEKAVSEQRVRELEESIGQERAAIEKQKDELAEAQRKVQRRVDDVAHVEVKRDKELKEYLQLSAQLKQMKDQLEQKLADVASEEAQGQRMKAAEIRAIQEVKQREIAEYCKLGLLRESEGGVLGIGSTSRTGDLSEREKQLFDTVKSACAVFAKDGAIRILSASKILKQTDLQEKLRGKVPETVLQQIIQAQQSKASSASSSSKAPKK
ncbi:MAG: M protein repeat protein [candidate division TM6 bacterium GW2011_GWF2_37_49]|nr:MAG: M protein repeat protein [candidate division TM6 bacterium GW2011_GWF2_37_49]